MTCSVLGGLEPAGQVAGPMPRRGGFTITSSGAAGWASAHAVASPATKLTPGGAVAVAAATASDGQLDAGDRPAGRRTRQGEAADTAVEVPDGRRVERGDPRAGLGVERRRDERVGLEEPLRPQRQLESFEPHRQRRRWRQHDLALALEHGRVRRLDVEGDDAQRRKRGEQPRQVLADPRLVGGRTHHEPQHQLAVGRLREEDVLELAAALADVVRRQVGPRDEVRHDLQGGREARGVQPAVAQVDAVVLPVEDAERRRLAVPPTTILALLRNPAVRARRPSATRSAQARVNARAPPCH